MLCVAVATFAALAATSQGFPVQHVSLNDGGIWVTNNAIGAIGHFDKPIAQLDGQVNATSATPILDVWQNGSLVAAYDSSVDRLYSVNVYQPAFAGGAVSVSASHIALGGSTLAVLGSDGTLRTATLERPGEASPPWAPPPRRAPRTCRTTPAVAVASDGTAYVAGGGELAVTRPTGPPATSGLPFPAGDTLQVTTVGTVPVVADATSRTLYLPASGRTVTLPSQDTSTAVQLQQSSPQGSVVAVATALALYRVDLGTGQLTTLSTGHSGDVAAPVQVAGCIHAAWNNGPAGSYARNCGGQAAATVEQSFPLSSARPSLVFRVNRGEVVLNDTADGGVFLVDTKVTNADPKWQQVVQPAKDHSTNTDNTTELTQAPLIAKPCTQGVRPDRTTVVHVLDHDSGPSGRPLAVTAVGQPDQPGVTVTIAPDAQTVLATVGRPGRARALPVHDRRRARPDRLGRGHAGAARPRREQRSGPAAGLPSAEPYRRLRRQPHHPGHR